METEFPGTTEPKKVLLMGKEFSAFHCHWIPPPYWSRRHQSLDIEKEPRSDLSQLYPMNESVYKNANHWSICWLFWPGADEERGWGIITQPWTPTPSWHIVIPLMISPKGSRFSHMSEQAVFPVSGPRKNKSNSFKSKEYKPKMWWKMSPVIQRNRNAVKDIRKTFWKCWVKYGDISSCCSFLYEKKLDKLASTCIWW